MAATPPKTPSTAKKEVDWEGMEPLWRAGIISVAELSRRFKVSRPGIEKHFAKLGITRDLTSKIQGEAAALVQRAEAAGGHLVAPEPSQTTDGKPTDTETVAVNARMQATVILRQRTDIRRAQELAGELLTELRSQTFDRALYEQLDTLLRAAGKAGKLEQKKIAPLMALYERATTTSQRAENLRKLAEVMKVLTDLERKVLAIADDAPADPSARIGEAIASGLDELRKRFREKLGSA